MSAALVSGRADAGETSPAGSTRTGDGSGCSSGAPVLLLCGAGSSRASHDPAGAVAEPLCAGRRQRPRQLPLLAPRMKALVDSAALLPRHSSTGLFTCRSCRTGPSSSGSSPEHSPLRTPDGGIRRASSTPSGAAWPWTGTSAAQPPRDCTGEINSGKILSLRLEPALAGRGAGSAAGRARKCSCTVSSASRHSMDRRSELSPDLDTEADAAARKEPQLNPRPSASSWMRSALRVSAAERLWASCRVSASCASLGRKELGGPRG